MPSWKTNDQPHLAASLALSIASSRLPCSSSSWACAASAFFCASIFWKKANCNRCSSADRGFWAGAGTSTWCSAPAASVLALFRIEARPIEIIDGGFGPPAPPTTLRWSSAANKVFFNCPAGRGASARLYSLKKRIAPGGGSAPSAACCFEFAEASPEAPATVEESQPSVSEGAAFFIAAFAPAATHERTCSASAPACSKRTEGSTSPLSFPDISCILCTGCLLSTTFACSLAALAAFKVACRADKGFAVVSATTSACFDPAWGSSEASPRNSGLTPFVTPCLTWSRAVRGFAVGCSASPDPALTSDVNTVLMLAAKSEAMARHRPAVEWSMAITLQDGSSGAWAKLPST
mmetsp:Transcript_59632/g.155029  ORF Transcript_59632/g.155029 Transcript_59632/m.155029 type:complete len:350 (-) Transcript_59632:22-1071(-)